MISLAQRPLKYRPQPRLGQAVSVATPALLVSVVDRQGKPAQGVDVVAFSKNGQEAARAKTDSHGDVNLPLTTAPYDVEVIYNGHNLWKEVSAEQISRRETIVFDMPFCVRDPLLKPIDIGLLVAAGGLAGAGMYWDVKPLTVAGEVIFGATMFSIIYRLSCL